MSMDDGGFYRRETQYFESEPDVDDSVKFCPDCERPNQFGELCRDCQHEQNCEANELAMRGDDQD